MIMTSAGVEHAHIMKRKIRAKRLCLGLALLAALFSGPMVLAQSKSQTLVYDCDFAVPAASADLFSPRLLLALRGERAYIIDGVLLVRGQSPLQATIRSNQEKGIALMWVAKPLTSDSDRPITGAFGATKISFGLTIDKSTGAAAISALPDRGRPNDDDYLMPKREHAKGVCAANQK
jgi:hypothetical protein